MAGVRHDDLHDVHAGLDTGLAVDDDVFYGSRVALARPQNHDLVGRRVVGDGVGRHLSLIGAAVAVEIFGDHMLHGSGGGLQLAVHGDDGAEYVRVPRSQLGGTRATLREPADRPIPRLPGHGQMRFDPPWHVDGQIRLRASDLGRVGAQAVHRVVAVLVGRDDDGRQTVMRLRILVQDRGDAAGREHAVRIARLPGEHDEYRQLWRCVAQSGWRHVDGRGTRAESGGCVGYVHRIDLAVRGGGRQFAIEHLAQPFIDGQGPLLHVRRAERMI